MVDHGGGSAVRVPVLAVVEAVVPHDVVPAVVVPPASLMRMTPPAMPP